MPDTREIPRSEWQDFFTSFSVEHDEHVVAVEVMGSEIGAQVEGRELRLRGISPGQNYEDADLALMFDALDGTHLTHMVAKPSHVWLRQTPGRTDEAIEIQSADGTTTLVRFAGASVGRDEDRIDRDDDLIGTERLPRKGDDEDL